MIIEFLERQPDLVCTGCLEVAYGEAFEHRLLSVGQVGRIAEPEIASASQELADFAFSAPHLIDGVIDDLDGMKLVEGDSGGRQVIGDALDESRAHIDAHLSDGTGLAAVRGEIVGKERDRLNVPAFGCEHDAGLVDIDKQRDVVVASPGRGLVDCHPPDGRKIDLRPGTIDVMVNDAPQPGVMFADQTGYGVDRHRRDQAHDQRLEQQGEAVWVPDAVHEAVRDLVRAREAAADDLRRKRQQLLSFLLRRGRIYSGGGHWTLAHRRWLAKQAFEHTAQQIVFQEGIDAIDDAVQRLHRLEQQLAAIVPSWSMASVVAAYQAMRGASFLVAVTFAAEIGDVRRFDTPRQLMSFLGLVPAESSTGDTVRRKGLTLAGNRRARRALVEAAWTYRYPARVSETLRARIEGLPKTVRDIAWKAQLRLCARYRRLSAAGKKLPVVVAAIAREMAAFLWAIGREVAVM